MLNSVRSRLMGSLLLAPAIFLPQVWCGRYFAPEAIVQSGIAQFVILTAGVSLVTAYCSTMFIAYLKAPPKC